MNGRAKGILCLIGINLICGLSFTMTIFAGIFCVPLCEKLGVDYSQIAVMWTALTLGSLFSYAVIGKLFDKVSPKLIYAVGSVTFLLALTSLAYVKSVTAVVIIYFFVGVINCFISSGAQSIMTSAWVSVGRGAMVGMGSVVTAVFGAIFSPLASVWITKYGLEKTSIVSGVVMTVISLTLALFTVCSVPQKYGLEPIDLKFLAKREKKNENAENVSANQNETSLPLSRIRKIPVFWLILLAAFLISMVQNGFYSNRAGAFGEMGCSLMQIGILSSIHTIVVAVIVEVFGILCDKIGYRWPLILFSITGAFIYFMWPALKPMGFPGAVILVILSNVGQISNYLGPNVMLPLFGTKNANQLISSTFMAACIGGIIAPILIAAMKSYDKFFLICAVSFVIVTVVTAIATSRKELARVEAAGGKYRKEEGMAAEAASDGSAEQDKTRG